MISENCILSQTMYAYYLSNQTMCNCLIKKVPIWTIAMRRRFTVMYIWPSVVSAKKLDFRSRQLSFVPNGKGSILVSAKYNHIRFVPVCFMNSVEIELPITGDNNNFIVHRPWYYSTSILFYIIFIHIFMLF